MYIPTRIKCKGGIMSTSKKLYNKIKNNPKNVKFEEIDKLLINIGGFEKRSTKGSHFVYHHKKLGNSINEYVNIPYKKPTIRPAYIKKALAMFELVMEDIENL